MTKNGMEILAENVLAIAAGNKMFSSGDVFKMQDDEINPGIAYIDKLIQNWS